MESSLIKIHFALLTRRISAIFSSMDRETYSGAKEKVMEVMLEILDGFVIE